MFSQYLIDFIFCKTKINLNHKLRAIIDNCWTNLEKEKMDDTVFLNVVHSAKQFRCLEMDDFIFSFRFLHLV